MTRRFLPVAWDDASDDERAGALARDDIVADLAAHLLDAHRNGQMTAEDYIAARCRIARMAFERPDIEATPEDLTRWADCIAVNIVRPREEANDGQ